MTELLKTDMAANMTKREAFALAAMQALLANPYYAAEMAGGQMSGTVESAAMYHADALLAELAKQP